MSLIGDLALETGALIKLDRKRKSTWELTAAAREDELELWGSRRRP